MTRQTLRTLLEANSGLIERIRQRAHAAHDDVNQRYGGTLPYGVHLDSVADNTVRYLAEVCDEADDVVPVVFGAYFHDAIEDARLTYNDVMAIARGMMDDRQALMATEIAYALTNEKGRTRAQRADRRYYSGIRVTPYAPLVKMADRLANARYSATHDTPASRKMHAAYAAENAHFVAALTADVPAADRRMHVPQPMIDELVALLGI